MTSLILAIRTLTRLPIPGEHKGALAQSLPYFPFVGAILAALLLGTGYGWSLSPFFDWYRGQALVYVVLLALLTGGLHLDGLADWADSFGADGDKERALQIMKDPGLGAFGAVALVLYLLLQLELITKLLEMGLGLWLWVLLVLSRGMMVELMCFYPNARGSGLGQAYMESANKTHRLLAQLFALVLVYPFFGAPALSAWGVAFLWTHFFGVLSTKRLGGITGDLIGANGLLIELILLILALMQRPVWAPIWGGW